MWNRNISEAPRDVKVWLASECGKVIPTTWDKKREQWAGFATHGKPPVAWQPYIVPDHPGKQSDVGAIAAVNGKAGLANATSVEPSASGLITHKHIFLDDCGSGA